MAVDYSREALGQVIEQHRKARGLSQQQLGELAGYGSGAAVSISRVETGRVRPPETRRARIAAALGLTSADLEAAATERTQKIEAGLVPARQSAQSKQRVGDLEKRAERLERVARRREEVHVGTVDDFLDAFERSRDQFYMPLADISSSIDGADRPVELPLPGEPTTSAAERAAHKFQIAKSSVATVASFSPVRVAHSPLLITPAADPRTGQLVAYGVLQASMRWGKAGTGARINRLSGASRLSAAKARIGGGPKVNGGGGMVRGDQRLNGIATAVQLGIPLLALFAQLSVLAMEKWQTTALIAELATELDEAEAEFNASRRGYEAIEEILPRATAVLDDIAVHGTRALNRWTAQLGPLPRDTLASIDQQRYQDFLELSSCQFVLGAISVDDLLESTGQDQEDLIAEIDEAVNQAEATVARLV